MNDLDDLLAGRHRTDDVFANGARTHLFDKVLHHRQGDVGLDQRGAHFRQRRVDVRFGQGATTAKLVEDATQAGL